MEHRTPSQPLLAERAAAWLTDQFQENKLPFLASLIWGLLAYTFAFTNKLINHDEAGQLFGKGATITSGRWGLALLDSIFPNWSMPWIYGIITIVLFAISICILIQIFSVRNKLVQVLLAGSIMVFPSLIGLFGYMFTSTSYALSFLLAVLSVWLICQPGWLCRLCALGCLIFSLGIYQSYISVAASLLVLILIRQLLLEEDALPVLKKGIFFVAFLILALALYYALTQAALAIKGISFSDYAADSIALSFSSIIDGIILAYVNFVRFFVWAHHRLMPTSLSRWMHLFLFAAIGVLLLLCIFRQKRKDIARILLLLFLIAILPLAINCMYMITEETAVHTLVLYSFTAVYVLAAILADLLISSEVPAKLPDLLRRAALNVAILSLTVIIVINTYVANACYLSMHLRYENAYAFYSSLIADLKMMPEFTEDTKLAIIGDWDSPDFYENNLEFTGYLIGTNGFLPNTYTQGEFLEYYLGFSIPFASEDEIAQISESPEFEEMAVYPYYGSMQLFGNTLVVKLS